MRGNNSNTITPFILFSVHDQAVGVEVNEELAVATTLDLTQQGVPFKRISLHTKGRDRFENLLIVDTEDEDTARELAQKAGQGTIVVVSPYRVGTRVSVNKFDKSHIILGTLESVQESSLESGDIYLKDTAGTCWGWK